MKVTYGACSDHVWLWFSFRGRLRFMVAAGKPSAWSWATDVNDTLVYAWMGPIAVLFVR